MAAVPYSPLPTFRALRDRLAKEFGCTFETEVLEAKGIDLTLTFVRRPRREEFRERYFEWGDDDEVVARSVLRSLLSSLEIPIEDFGLLPPSSWGIPDDED